MELEIYSDVVCPWCYLGHRRLSQAIDRIGDGSPEIRLRWRAFQLDPSTTAEPRDLRSTIDRKYGPGSFEVMAARLGALGEEAGIEYRFDRALRVGTFDAHRLLQWAQDRWPGSSDALAESLFRAYFTDGANIAEHPTLCSLAQEAGLDPAEAAEVLGSGAYSERVRSDVARAAELGVTGVPAVLYNGAVVVPGAQDTATIERVMGRLIARSS